MAQLFSRVCPNTAQWTVRGTTILGGPLTVLDSMYKPLPTFVQCPGMHKVGRGGGWGVITRFYSTTAYSPAKVDHTMQQLNQMLHVTETNMQTEPTTMHVYVRNNIILVYSYYMYIINIIFAHVHQVL